MYFVLFSKWDPAIYCYSTCFFILNICVEDLSISSIHTNLSQYLLRWILEHTDLLCFYLYDLEKVTLLLYFSSLLCKMAIEPI